jgi:large subunit ribosomal protein L6
MSRIGKLPIQIPDKVEVKVDGQHLVVKGPLGELEHTFRDEVTLAIQDNVATVTRNGETRLHSSLHGLSRTLFSNMVEGVSKGYEKTLLVCGVGYTAEVKGNGILLRVGYSHPIWIGSPPAIRFELLLPNKWTEAGITKQVDGQNVAIKVSGPSKALVGQVAARIRKIRPPEPYKGKGIRYNNEQVRRKAGKAAK